MERLKGTIRATLSNDSFEEIFWGSPSQKTFRDATATFKKSSLKDKESIIKRSLKKLNKSKTSESHLANLLLLHKINKTNPVILPKELTINATDKSKDNLATESLVELYLDFLKRENQITALNVLENNLVSDINQCMNMAEQVKKIIQKDFVITYCVKSMFLHPVLTLVCRQMLENMSEKFKYMNSFMEKNAHMIHEEHSSMFQVNQIYQNLINFSRSHNRTKLHLLCKLLSLQKPYPYILDSQVNKLIEQTMLPKRNEYMSYLREKQYRASDATDININPEELDEQEEQFLLFV